MLILGAFDDSGNATIRIRVAGPLGTKEYTAVIDTGFSGFVALPQTEMVPLGLATGPSAASVMLGNGQVIYNLVAEGTVTIADQQAESGPILLDETSNEVLIGMAFLRAFKLALIVTDAAVVLHDRQETLEAIAGFMQTAPVGLPNTSPSILSSDGVDDE